MSQKGKPNHRIPLATVVLLASVATACTSGEYTLRSARSRQVTQTPDDSGSTYRIKNVVVQSGSGGTARLFFDAASTAGAISDVCQLATASGSTNAKACQCVFSWDQVNTTGSAAVVFSRSVTTPLTNVQEYLTECTLPSVYSTEIPDNTIVKIKVAAASGNANAFTVSDYRYTKNGVAQAGSFQDAEGRAFDNIFRYSCFSKFKRGIELKSRLMEVQDPNDANNQIRVASATDFCFESALGGGSWDARTCGASSGLQPSAQSYYYNLYTRSTDKGSINLSNEGFTCPLVRESLNPSGINGDFWPLDSSFALALTPSTEFPVGVEAAIRVDTGDGPVQSSCFGSGSSQTGDGTGLVSGCLGFAAKPARDGTCPTFKDATGTVRPTFRLRRFYALYPPLFDTSGKALPGAQGQDTIYVIDRPVTLPGGDPLKPYTMAGPKPCPFAYFDHRTASAGATDPQYVATNDSAWEGKNIDGIQFPNFDGTDASGHLSCSAALPVLNDAQDKFTIATVNAANPKYPSLHVRGEKPWSPYYQEDTDFLACAPLATNFRDPPLHFARDSSTGNVAWCAEAYPTQNPFVSALEAGRATAKQQQGLVRPFTSHASKNSASGRCTPTVLAPGIMGYSAAEPLPPPRSCAASSQGTRGAALHVSTHIIDRAQEVGGVCSTNYVNPEGGYCHACADQSCDRSVQSSGTTWQKFPLLAPAQDVESALIEESASYGCLITYDAGNGKTGKFSPKEGCCGAAVKVWTANTAPNNHPTAHLEPSAVCQTPRY